MDEIQLARAGVNGGLSMFPESTNSRSGKILPGRVPTVGVRHRSGGLCRLARLPVVFKACVEMATAQSDDGVSSPNRPEHAGPFETRTDYGLAPGFGASRAAKK